jgi:hypothetical protein
MIRTYFYGYSCSWKLYNNTPLYKYHRTCIFLGFYWDCCIFMIYKEYSKKCYRTESSSAVVLRRTKI